MIKPGYRKPKDLFKTYDHMRSRRKKDRIIKLVYFVFIIVVFTYYVFKS